MNFCVDCNYSKKLSTWEDEDCDTKYVCKNETIGLDPVNKRPNLCDIVRENNPYCRCFIPKDRKV